MAVSLNKNRMVLSRLLTVFVILLGFVSEPMIPAHTPAYLLFQLSAYILLAACALGRVYATAFIGGIKNEQLMTRGPYAMCRNPLYFYSLLGAAGIGFASGQLLTLVLITGGFLALYLPLIRREEAFLAEKFGSAFAAYRARTPRLIPNPKLFASPEEMLFQPRYLTFAVWDAVAWFLPIPLFALARILQESGVITPWLAIL